nr:MAG TPA: hypothetical protein [Caudoviricetes sp.]
MSFLNPSPSHHCTGGCAYGSLFAIASSLKGTIEIFSLYPPIHIQFSKSTLQLQESFKRL